MTSCPRKRLGIRYVALVAVTLMSLGSVAMAQNADRKADGHLARGQKLFADGKYGDAIEELRAGYVLAPQPRFLYALGQAYRLNHQCLEAVKAYRDFMNSEPPKAQAVAAEQNIKRCGDEDPQSIVEPPAPTVVKPVTPEPATVVTKPVDLNLHPTDATVAQTATKKTPVYKKWWLWTIVGVVVIGAGVGIGLGLHSTSNFKSTLPDVGPGSASMALSPAAAP